MWLLYAKILLRTSDTHADSHIPVRFFTSCKIDAIAKVIYTRPQANQKNFTAL
jgi:hypothetical protein